MDVDFISRDKHNKEYKSKLKGKGKYTKKKRDSYCKICKEYGHTLERYKYNGKTNGRFKHKENYNNKKQQSSNSQTQEKFEPCRVL